MDRLEVLLELNEDINGRDEHGQSALHLAVLWCDPEVVDRYSGLYWYSGTVVQWLSRLWHSSTRPGLQLNIFTFFSFSQSAGIWSGHSS